jgi:predicted aspartyl protease
MIRLRALSAVMALSFTVLGGCGASARNAEPSTGPVPSAETLCAQGDQAACAEAKRVAEIYRRLPLGSLPDSDTATPTVSGHGEIALHRSGGGTFTVPVSINGAITLEFTIDSGAADVSIPADVVMTLMRTGTVNRSDFLGSRTYVLADGSTTPSPIFRIRSLRVGGREVQNVTASIAPVKGGLLLGQTFLRHFGSWSFDNRRGVLVLD